MNYQSIRATIEAPLLTVFNSQAPAIPVYFDNITALPPDPPSEYVRIYVGFGLTTTSGLSGSFDWARGILIVRCYAPKSTGPARCQQLVQLAKGVIDTINATSKTTVSTFLRIGDIKGPVFESPENMPHFVGRIDAGWQASVR